MPQPKEENQYHVGNVVNRAIGLIHFYNGTNQLKVFEPDRNDDGDFVGELDAGSIHQYLKETSTVGLQKSAAVICILCGLEHDLEQDGNLKMALNTLQAHSIDHILIDAISHTYQNADVQMSNENLGPRIPIYSKDLALRTDGTAVVLYRNNKGALHGVSNYHPFQLRKPGIRDYRELRIPT